MVTNGYRYNFVPTKSHIISVNWGNGKVEKFVMKAESGGLSSLKTASFTFESMDGSKSKLIPTINTKSWMYENGYFFKFNEDYDDISFNPDTWQLTRADGSKYLIDCKNGILAYMDANGNQINFGKNGFANTDGDNIVFNRDSSGRITSIEEKPYHTHMTKTAILRPLRTFQAKLQRSDMKIII